MNFSRLYHADQKFDEIMPIGEELEKDGKIYHIAGMVRCQNKAQLYIIEQNDSVEEVRGEIDAHYNNRVGMKIIPALNYFSAIEKIKIGEQDLETESVCSEPLELARGYNCDAVMLFTEMIRAGWRLPDDSDFLFMDWKNILWTKMSFHTEIDKLPNWNKQEISVKFRVERRCHFVEKPVRLAIGQESEIDFSLENGQTGTCYINKVYPIDVWKENEEKFKAPRFVNAMTKEELEKHKKEFFQELEKDCPKGMCYLGIEYECTLEGNLAFYSRDFLESEPKVSKGSVSLTMMLLRPEEAVGKHGIKQHGCIIQTPAAPDIQQMEAELFCFMEMLPEREERFWE